MTDSDPCFVSTALRVNGRDVALRVEARSSLADVLRDELSLTGTHVGCEQGVCGACTILVDGLPMRSCIMLAAAAQGSEITTIEGLDGQESRLLREAFSSEHGLQCGFCTPGMIVAATDLLKRKTCLTPDVVRREMSGNLCRCTGYAGIVRAIVRASKQLAECTHQKGVE